MTWKKQQQGVQRELRAMAGFANHWDCGDSQLPVIVTTIPVTVTMIPVTVTTNPGIITTTQ